MSAEDWGRGDRRRLSLRDYPPAVLELIDHRQGGRFCALCQEQGLITPEGEALEIDHLQPLSRGGDNNYFNLRWLCASHNSQRGAKPGFVGEPAWSIRAAGRRP